MSDSSKPPATGSASRARSSDREYDRIRGILSRPQSWGSLHSIYEIVESDVHPNYWGVLGVSEQEIEALRLSLIRGDHRTFFGRLHDMAKDRPLMTLDDAYVFVRRMVNEWMKWRRLSMRLACLDRCPTVGDEVEGVWSDLQRKEKAPPKRG
jgi:hypothetical protein